MSYYQVQKDFKYLSVNLFQDQCLHILSEVVPFNLNVFFNHFKANLIVKPSLSLRLCM